MIPDVLFERRISDAVKAAQKNSVEYTNFLSDDEQRICERILSKEKINYSFDGGFINAERKVCALYTDDFEAEWLSYPLSLLKIVIKDPEASLSYSDFLGSIMGLGLKRNVVGDIIVKGNEGYVSVLETVSSHIAGQLEQVGRYSCSTEIFSDFQNLKKEDKFIPVKILVSSNRLDCFVSALCGLSREAASNLIKSGTVFVNGEPCVQPIKKLNEKDKLTVRGTGKFLLASNPEDADSTKKGRLKIEFLKYGS